MHKAVAQDNESAEVVLKQIIQAKRVWLFLDYDGTLADFEATPASINPDPGLCTLLNELVQSPGLRLVTISGRRLTDLRALLPVAGMWLAGTYGTDWWTPQGCLIERLDARRIRPVLDAIKVEWQKLIEGENAFYLEDKGLALALHARYAEDDRAAEKLGAARQIIEHFALPDQLRTLGGHKFLEVAPLLADKGQAVSYLLSTNPWGGAKLVYVGDDDKDEAAFEVIHSLGGTSILVSKEWRPTRASSFLESPQQVRQWLGRILLGRLPGN